MSVIYGAIIIIIIIIITENALTQTQWCKNSGFNIVPTHIMLLSRAIPTFSPSVSRSCRFYSQRHIQITRRHNFDCHPEANCSDSCAVSSAGLSRDQLYLLDLSRLLFDTPLYGDKLSCAVKTEWIQKQKKRKMFGD